MSRNDYVERLVVELMPLVSLSIYTEDDLRQTIHMYCLRCEKNYNPERGDFYSYLSNSVRNGIKKSEVNIDIDDNVSTKDVDNIMEYIPWDKLTGIERDVLSDYLYGYSFHETSHRLSCSINRIQKTFEEIVLKIQEANEK